MLSKMSSIALEYGVVFNVEPHMGSIIDTPEKALSMIKQVPELSYTLDYAHFEGKAVPQAEVALLHKFVNHMHAKQARAGHPKCLKDEGTIDFHTITRQLEARNWDGVIAVECIGDIHAAVLEYNPVFQTVLLAYDVAQAIAEL